VNADTSPEPVPSSGAGMASELELVSGVTDSLPEVGFLPFHGADIPIKVDGAGNWPSVTALSNTMGVDSNGQRQAILRKHWAQGWTCVTHVQLPGDTQRREHFFIHEKRVPMWLANIDTSRIRDEQVRARVEATQVEFADVLAEWTSTGEVKPKVPPGETVPELPVDYETALVHLLASVRERKALAARNAELEDAAEGYAHFLEKDGTAKWANACDYLGVAPNLFGAHLRARKYTYTDEYFVEREGRQEKRQGERHNHPYAEYKHWFAFPAYDAKDPESRAKLERVPEHRQFDRRVTKAGLNGLRLVLKRHVVECGRCSMCDSVRRSKPTVFVVWRPHTQIGA
jgi:P22_AR N-terminal domain